MVKLRTAKAARDCADDAGGLSTVCATSRDPAPGATTPLATRSSTYARSAARSGHSRAAGTPINAATAPHCTGLRLLYQHP